MRHSPARAAPPERGGRDDLPLYLSQEWLWNEAAGRYDIDLAISGMEARDATVLLPDGGVASYTLDRGVPALCETLAELYGRPEREILVTHGAQEATYLLFASLLRPGDEVVCTTPAWQQTAELAERFGATVRRIELRPEDAYRPDPDALAAAIGERTRVVYLIDPHNPTGSRVPPATWRALAAAIGDRPVHLVADEVYLTDYRDSAAHHHPLACALSSLSKVHGYPGLRTGWLVGPEPVVRAATNYRRYTTICTSPLLQAAARRVLEERERHVAEYRRRLETGWRIFADWFDAEAPALRPVPPDGAPFVLCGVALPGVSARELCRRLLAEERVVVMPGDVFEAPGSVRISFARPPEVLEEGLARLGRLLGRLTPDATAAASS